MKIFFQSKNHGIALIIVMIVIVVLAILAGAFAYTMRVEMRLAAQSNNEAEFEWLGRSGVELARFLLGEQAKSSGSGGSGYDALSQKWAGGTKDTNDAFANINLENNELGTGTFSIKITDLERKVNVNSANQLVLQRALDLIGMDAGASPGIVDSIIDWRDQNEDAGISGAESQYYQTLSPPYFAKNGWIDDLSELLLIRGITPEIYWGSASTNHPVSAFHQLQGSALISQDAPFYPIGLVDVFTPISNGRVNINTASASTLQMFPGGLIDEATAQQIIQTRAGLDGTDGTEDDVPFRNTGELVNVPGLNNQQVASQMGSFFGVKSSAFEVHVDTQIGNTKRRYIAWLWRNQNNVQILKMHWE